MESVKAKYNSVLCTLVLYASWSQNFVIILLYSMVYMANIIVTTRFILSELVLMNGMHWKIWQIDG